VVSQPPPTNLLKNGGFEFDANGNGRPDNWSSNSKFIRSDARAFSGKYSGRHRATDNSGYTVRQRVSNVSAGTTYDFAAQVNIPATTDRFTFRLEVRWLNSSNSTINIQTIKTYNAQTSGWDAASRSLVAPAGTVRADVRMVLGSLNARVFVDQFVVTE
jgi:hypothetical protein